MGHPNTSQGTMTRRFALLLLMPLLLAACGGGSASPSGSAKASAGLPVESCIEPLPHDRLQGPRIAG